MGNKEKTELDLLEESLMAFWKRNKKRRIIKGFHTEIEIEPRVFMRGNLNPEIAATLSEQILLQLLSNKEEAKRVTISNDLITINDEAGNPIIEIKDPKIIRGILSK